MYNIEICMSYAEKYCEVLPDDVYSTKMILADLIRSILLGLFREVKIDRISLQVESHWSESRLIQIRARCAERTFPSTAQQLEQIELVLEDRVSCALVQLLGIVEVERVTIMPSPDERQKLTLLPSDYQSDRKLL